MEYQQDFNKCEILLNPLRLSVSFGVLAERYNFGDLEMVKRDVFQIYLPFKTEFSALSH